MTTEPKGDQMDTAYYDRTQELFLELLAAIRDDVKISIGVNLAAGHLLQHLEDGKSLESGDEE